MKRWRKKTRVWTREYRLGCRKAHNQIIKGSKEYASKYCKMHHMPMSRRERKHHVGIYTGIEQHF